MTHAAPNPEDRQQLDALASRLAELQPAPASVRLQAQVFYLAGIQAARSELHYPRESSRWLARAAIIGLMVGSSGLSYWAGTWRSTNVQMAAAPAVAASEKQTASKVAEQPVIEQPGLPPIAPNNAANALAREQATVPQISADEASTAFKPAAFGLPFTNWLKLPRVTPDEYLRLVEARTTPLPSRNAAAQAPPPDRPTEESLLRELYGTPPPSPLWRWLPML